MARIPQGSGVTLTFKVWQLDGVTPLDATNPVLTLRRPLLPDVTYSGGQVGNPGTGSYTVAVPKTDLADLGRYAWAVTADSPQGVLAQRSFDIIDPFLPGLITLDDARSALGKSNRNVDVDELQLHVDTANEQIELLTGPAVPRTVVDVLTADRGGLRLSRRPGLGDGAFLTLTAATVGAVPAAVDVMTWQQAGGRVTARAGYVVLPGQPYTVTYRVGRQPIPGSLLLAARLLVQHLWKPQRAAAPGVPADGVGDVVNTGYGFAVPYAVAELVAPYSYGPGVA